MTRSILFTAILASFIVCVAVSGVTAATEIDGKPNNPYGVQLGMWGGNNSDYASIHFQWANDLVGDWGHIRVDSGAPSMDVHGAVRTLAIARAKKLIPVMIGLYVPEEYRIPGGQDAAPYIMDDYPLAAQHYGQWASELAKLGAVVPYYEVANEINGKWETEAYGRFIISVSKAFKAAMPDMQVVSAGLAGNGADFIDDMLTVVPEAADHIDCWGLHPYGANHPPAYDQDGYCLKGHLWTAAALRKHGIDNPRFVMTESGYEIGNKVDHRYPRITDELRAKYIVEAYETIWEPDPRVVSQMLFILHTAVFPGWDGWALVDQECKPTETFKAMAAMPKPEGSDWMPQGDCFITGRITDADSGQGLERVFVYTVPGIYAAETDSDGNYTISNIPDGSYDLHIFRDGFTSPPVGSVTASSTQSAEHDATMKRVGLITDGMDSGVQVANGWMPLDTVPDADYYAVDTEVMRNGTGSQRLRARAGAPVGVWQCTDYATAVPDRPFAAEIWVKGRGVKLGDGKGVTFSLSVTDIGAVPYSTSEINLPLEGDYDWTPMTVSISPYPIGRRLVLMAKLDAVEGEIWFDDPYCHYAEYPVSSRALLGEGTSEMHGEVKAEHGEYVAEAMVCLSPGNIWTTTRSDGTYTLSGIPAGTYTASAFLRGKMGIVHHGLEIDSGEEINLDLDLRNPPAPREVQNPSFLERGEDKYFTPGWIKYREFDGIPENGWHPDVPEHPEGFHARTGNSFAGSIAGSNVKNGGLYQIIEVDPDKTYEVSVWSYTYQTEGGRRGDVANRLGVDPTGGTDPDGLYVIWTPPTPSQKEWSQLTLKVAPVEDRLTIFLEAKQIHGLMYNVNCFDDVSVVEAAESLPPRKMVTY